MKGLYTRIGRHYFANPEARSLALGFYHKLSALCSEGASTIRCTKQCVAMGMRVARFGTGCRKSAG